MPEVLLPDGTRLLVEDGQVVASPTFGGSEEGFTPYPGAGTFYGQAVPEGIRDYLTVAGEAFTDYYRGVNVANRDAMQAEREAARGEIEAARARSPFASFLGDITPEIAMGAATAATRNPALLVGAGAAEGIRMRDTVGEQVFNAVLGAGSPMVGQVMERTLKQAFGMADTLRTEASRRARDIGMPTTAGEQSGGGIVGALEAAADDIPLSGALRSSPADVRQVELNRAANEAIGQTGDVVTKENMDAAARAVGSLREGVDESIGAVIVPEGAANRIREVYPRVRNREAFDTFQAFGKSGEGRLKVGEATKLWRRMVKMADSATDPNVADDIKDEILPVMEEMITGKLGPEGAQNWRDYREMWRVHSILREGKSMTGGNVNAGALRSRLARNMPGAIHMGQLDNLTRPESQRLVEMADLTGGGWLGVPNPNSGTSFRAARAIGPLAAAGADAGLIAAGMPPLVSAGIAGALGANAAAQGAIRAAPDFFGGISAQRGTAGVLGEAGSFLDEILYPYIGAEDEREP